MQTFFLNKIQKFLSENSLLFPRNPNKYEMISLNYAVMTITPNKNLFNFIVVKSQSKFRKDSSNLMSKFV